LLAVRARVTGTAYEANRQKLIEAIWKHPLPVLAGNESPYDVPPSPPTKMVHRDIKEEPRQGRRRQVYATYTGEKDVTHRLETVLQQEGIRVAVLRSSVPTDKRDDWYERQLKAGTDVVICHPKLVETGLDLLAFPTLYF
jgi:hypothetical protein